MVRFAKEHELWRVNELRKQVNDVHTEGRPDIFKPGFGEELRDHLYTIWNDPNQKIAVAERDGKIVGFAVLNIIDRPENPFMYRRYFMDIDEFCVDAEYRRQGIATELIAFCRKYAKDMGFSKLELNMWEFNEGALAFYEEIGFTTYRRYMEMDLTEEAEDLSLCKAEADSGAAVEAENGGATVKAEENGRAAVGAAKGEEDKGTGENRKSHVDPELCPILEFDAEGEAIVDPEKFLKDCQLGYDKMVITFFPEVMKTLEKEGKIVLETTLSGENPIDIYRFVDSDVLICLGYVGCPACAGNLECFYAMGIRKVMFCGGGGVLDKSIAVGTPLVVTGAIRDEGFTFQYLPAGRVVYADPLMVKKVTDYLEGVNIPYITGLTWTTDAMFRETRRRIDARKAEGAKIVEMEQSGCLAIAQIKGFSYGAIIYGGDDVSGENWDSRSWNSRAGIRYDLVMTCREIVKTL